VCPVCGKGLTIGVEYRVEQITDQPTDKHPDRKPFHKMLPLHEVIAATKSWPVAGRKTWELYNRLMEVFGNEFNVLLHASRQDMNKALPQEALLAELILQNMEGKIKVKPGYDGVYGVAVVGDETKKDLGMDQRKEQERRPSHVRVSSKQKGLADFG
jgi:PHP family Zn ribbon phosphoesterase